jgi:hypothetical protein
MLAEEHAKAKPGQRVGNRPQLRPLAAHSGFDVYHSEFKEPEPVIDRLLYPGLTIFVARPKVGKSWMRDCRRLRR